MSNELSMRKWLKGAHVSGVQLNILSYMSNFLILSPFDI